MKRLLFFSLLLVAFANCHKSPDEKTTSLPNALLGKWTYTEYYVGIGDGVTRWQPVQPPNQIVAFLPDGRFQPTASFLSSATHYEIMDSSRVKFSPVATPSGPDYIIMAYRMDTTGALLLSPVNPICICGCADKFRRSKL